MKEHLKRSRMVQISASWHVPVRSKKTTKNDLNFGQNVGRNVHCLITFGLTLLY